MIDPSLQGYFDNHINNFIAANGTKCKILCDVNPAQVMPAVSTEAALPGEASVRQRVMTGGRRVVDGIVTSSDATARSVLMYSANQMTLAANMGTITTTATTNSTITRSAGSFITDGWTVGDTGMVFGSISASSANDGSLFIVTGVAAGVLTLNGTSGISVAGTEGAGYRIFKVGQEQRRPIPAQSGTTDTAAAVTLWGGTIHPITDTTGIWLNANGAIIVGMAAAVSALPAVVTVTAKSLLY